MSNVARKTYDIPVETKWFVVHLEINSKTKEGKVFVEFQEKWAEKVENGKVTLAEFPLEGKDPSKKLKVIIDTDDNDHYIFQLFVDNLPLQQYMEHYNERYSVWEIEKSGAKSKFIYDKEAGHFHFKGVLIGTPEKQRIMKGEKQECESDRGYLFRVEHILERGAWVYELYVNNVWNNNVFVPKMGVNQ